MEPAHDHNGGSSSQGAIMYIPELLSPRSLGYSTHIDPRTLSCCSSLVPRPLTSPRPSLLALG